VGFLHQARLRCADLVRATDGGDHRADFALLDIADEIWQDPWIRGRASEQLISVLLMAAARMRIGTSPLAGRIAHWRDGAPLAVPPLGPHKTDRRSEQGD
jgi:hypothetical protein